MAQRNHFTFILNIVAVTVPKKEEGVKRKQQQPLSLVQESCTQL